MLGELGEARTLTIDDADAVFTLRNVEMNLDLLHGTVVTFSWLKLRC
jgi:hypothetical protein